MRGDDKIEQVTSIPQLREDLPLQKIAWKIQKACWVIIVILMLLIAFGLFGNGMLSTVTKTSGNVSLEYERFSRFQAPLTTTVRFNADKSPAGGNRPLTIRIPMDYLSRCKLESVFPETYKSKVDKGAMLYVFDTGNSKSLTIRFFTRPVKPGSVQGRWIVNDSAIRVGHFIYP